jgi:hypothetical protein
MLAAISSPISRVAAGYLDLLRVRVGLTFTKTDGRATLAWALDTLRG